MQATRKFILNLIKGTAKYEDIFFEDSQSVQKFNAESEFEILCGFPEFREYKEGKEGFKHMLELFEYSPQISKIPDVCVQYHLSKCLDDPKLKKLEKIIKSVKEDKAKITGNIASNYMEKLWEILNFSDVFIAKICLKIFPAVADCAEFYHFIKKKGFINDRAAFSSQVQLITSQLQHENYDDTVLNQLKPAFMYISPFLDTEQSFTELMNNIKKLCSTFGRDSSNHFCQLETVKSNISKIKQWFSRTEVRNYSYHNIS